ncbi:MAG: hypothetical protein EB141_20200 [Verrucomicrobia bacterium]|nr:hypothetical protein [Verrucomicrobiota bacterium]
MPRDELFQLIADRVVHPAGDGVTGLLVAHFKRGEPDGQQQAGQEQPRAQDLIQGTLAHGWRRTAYFTVSTV